MGRRNIDPLRPNAIIYVHPDTQMTYPRNIPISIPALLKRIPYEVNGYCANHLPEQILQGAQVLIMDVHWFFSLRGAKELALRARKCNPELILIAGGITATEFPEQLIDKFDFDFVLRGDGELPLPMLIKALSGEHPLDQVPNLYGKDGFNTVFSVKSYSLNKSDFDENQFYDIDFFPFMKKELISLHARNPGMPPFIYPFILPFRGCPINCDFCMGAPDSQKKLFGRKVVVRSPERLAEDFWELEQQSWIKFYNCLLDFITLLPETYSEKAIRSPSRLKVQYEFTKSPTADGLDLLLKNFNGGTIHFSADEMHLTSKVLADPRHLIKLVKQVQRDGRYVPILDYSSVYSNTDRDYRKVVVEVIKHTGCLAYDGSIWWSDFPVPDAQGFGDPAKFDFYSESAVTVKHAIANRLNATINMLDLLLPNKMLLILRRMYYSSFYTKPLLVRDRYLEIISG